MTNDILVPGFIMETMKDYGWEERTLEFQIYLAKENKAMKCCGIYSLGQPQLQRRA